VALLDAPEPERLSLVNFDAERQSGIAIKRIGPAVAFNSVDANLGVVMGAARGALSDMPCLQIP